MNKLDLPALALCLSAAVSAAFHNPWTALAFGFGAALYAYDRHGLTRARDAADRITQLEARIAEVESLDLKGVRADLKRVLNRG